MYLPTKWLDHVTEFPNRRVITDNGDGTQTVEKAQGEIIQQGTPQSATNFNNAEAGILDAHIAIGFLLNYARQNAWSVDRGTVTLTNTDRFPFNNSADTVALENVRCSTDYFVLTEIVSADGNPGEIVVTDRLENGFKIGFTGSASSVTVNYTVFGGELK